MTTVGHPYLGPRRHWANQRSRPCHSRAWAQAQALKHARESLPALVASASPATPVPTSVPASAFARVLARLRAWLARH